MTPEILSQLTVELYRAAGEYPSSEFQEQALQLVKPIVPFDYAVWGLFAIVDGKGIAHSMYPHNLSREACLDALKIAPQQDIFSHRIMKQPDRSHTAALEELPPDSAEFRQWLDKYDIGYALGTCTIQPDTGLMQSLALQRRQGGYAFSETERRFKEKLMPHLVESQRQNHRLQIRRELLRAWEEKHCTATVFRNGILFDAEDRFVELLRAEWPEWRGARLPEPLTKRIASRLEWRYQSRHLLLRAGPMGDFCLIIASSPGPLAQLTRREQEVAQLFARGLTHKAIAEQLFISPKTVRNHLTRVYGKLKVSNKTELLRRLGEADGQPAIAHNSNHRPSSP